MAANPRYVWLGDLPPARVRRLMARARLMVLSSHMEGGANVVSEAVVSGLPILASRIDGSVGLLGEAHPGYFPVSDTVALGRLMRRAETDPEFLAGLAAHGAARAALFQPERESALVGALMAELAEGRGEGD
jgi:glycosyltransferase involved in cell wall biosynthesis